MKWSKLIKYSALTLTLFASISSAQTRSHSVGMTLGKSTGEYKQSSQDGDGISQAYFFYNYQVIESLSIELAYNTASEINEFECRELIDDTWTCAKNNQNLFGLVANEFDLEGAILAIKGDAALSERNRLYAKLGAQYYDYSFERNNTFIEGDKDTGVFIETGWQYQWDLGIGMNVGARYQDLGELTLKSLNIGINYKF